MARKQGLADTEGGIVLLGEPEEVVDQLERAGFKVLEQIEDPAYEPKSAANSVPRNAAFIVTK